MTNLVSRNAHMSAVVAKSANLTEASCEDVLTSRDKNRFSISLVKKYIDMLREEDATVGKYNKYHPSS